VQFSPDGRWLIYTSEAGGIGDDEPFVQAVMLSPPMYGEIYAYRISDGSQCGSRTSGKKEFFPGTPQCTKKHPNSR
jgi:hypothetical protein